MENRSELIKPSSLNEVGLVKVSSYSNVAATRGWPILDLDGEQFRTERATHYKKKVYLGFLL
jgi:hypothetical protein